MNQDRFWHIWCTFVVVHVMLCDRLFAVFSHPHILVSIFSIASCFFSAVFFSHFPPHANSSPLSGFCTLHQVFCSGFWSSSLVCHVSRSSISGLCICYLTTNNFMLTFWIYEIWDTIFIQFILIFVLLYFSNFLLCSIKILQVSSSSIYANLSGEALLH